MSEKVQAQTKNSATPSQAAKPSSPQYQHPFTDERYESFGSNSNISKELEGIQPKIIRRSLNWQNITVEAPSRSDGMSLPGGIQHQQEQPGAVIGHQVAVDSEEKSAEELSNSTISTDGKAQQPKIDRARLDWRKIPVEAPTHSGGYVSPQPIQRQQEQLEETPAIQGQVAADSEQKSAEELSNSTISTDGKAQQPKIDRAGFNWRNITIAPSRGGASSTYPGGIQRQETSDEKEGEESTESPQMQSEGEIQAKCSECQQQEKEEQNKESLQTKLTVGAPGDKYEQEADNMAAKVMTMPDSAIQQPIQRQTEEETEAVQMQPLVNSITPLVQRSSEEEEEIQMKSGVQPVSNGSSQASGSVESSLAGSKGGGSALPDDVRSFMEPRFGADFSSIRVHNDSTAVQMNKELGAQAFAHGSDIYFGAGKSPGKDELTAHELTHTVQQGGAVRTKSVTQQEKKENKLQAKADLSQSPVLEPKIQRKENPQAQPAAAKVATPASQNAAASPAAKSEKGEQANTIEKPAVGGGAGAPSAPAGNGGGGGAGASSGGAAGDGAGASSGGNSPSSAQNDPGFKAVVNSTKTVATQEKNHPPAGTKSTEAQAAAVSPANEVESKAQDKQVQEMNQQQPGQFNAGAFKAALMEKISAATPKNLEEADNFKDQNQLDSVKGDLSSQVGDEKKQAADPIEEKTKEQPDPSGITPKPVTPLPPKQADKAPSDIGADKAAPKPKSESEVSLQEGSKSIDKQMADADITEQQLVKSNEPQFQSAVEAKNTAQTHANTAPQAYRQQEQGILTQAQAQAQTTAQTQLQGMHGGREQLLTGVAGLQVDTKGQDEQKRSEVANHIQGIYNKTKQKVETTLSQLDGEVTQQFDQGASAAKTEFENYVDQRMKRYKEERYSGFWGPGKWLWDKLFGMPSEVNTFYQEGKNKFLASMDKTIDQIANHVAKTLNTAKNEIAKGKQQISKYVAGLDPSLKQVGQQAAQDIQGKFDELEQSVDSKQEELIDNLAQKYNENLQQIDARIDQMKEENKGLVQKAIDFVVGVVKTIVELGKMLAQVLARAISVLPQILANPIGFFSNLVNGVKQGFQNFMQSIGQHLAKGLIGWLSGKVASAGVQMPESLDAKGIFTLVTQIMGLTYENVRERAAKRLGEEKVNKLESTFEMFIVLKNQGIAGLWQFVQDTIGDLNQKVMEPVKNYIIESVIKAGITWIFSLLTPASAFIKACQAIYELVMFFVERASQVVDLVNAVLDSIVAIANGAIGEAAKKIEEALAKALPLVIDLLARVLGLGGVSQKVQGMITKVRGPIDRAIDKVIDKGAKVANKAGDKFESGKDKGKKNKDKNNKREDKTQDKDNSSNRQNRADEKDQTRGHNDKADEKNQTRDKNNRNKGSKDNTKNSDKAKDNNDNKGKDSKTDKRNMQQKEADLGKAVADAERILSKEKATVDSVKAELPAIKSKYRLKSADLLKGKSSNNSYYIQVEINPKRATRESDLTPEAQVVEKLKEAAANKAKNYIKGSHWKKINSIKMGDQSIYTQENAIFGEIENDAKEWVDKNKTELINYDSIKTKKKNKFTTDEKKLKSIFEGEDREKFNLHLSEKPQDNLRDEGKKKAKTLKVELSEFDEIGYRYQNRPSYGVFTNIPGGASSGVTEKLKKAVNKNTIVDFMKAMSKNEIYKEITPTDFKNYWNKADDRDFLKNLFRAADPGKHEWLPSNMIPQVIDRASKASDWAVGARWIDFQHEVRTPTKYLIFDPTKFTDGTATIEETDGDIKETYTVLQGHAGAVYIKSGGKLVPQTKGQPKWHDDLRDLFTSSNNCGELLENIKQYFDQTIWKGNHTPDNIYDDHYDSSGGSLSIDKLENQQRTEITKIENDFTTWKTKFK